MCNTVIRKVSRMYASWPRCMVVPSVVMFDAMQLFSNTAPVYNVTGTHTSHIRFTSFTGCMGTIFQSHPITTDDDSDEDCPITRPAILPSSALQRLLSRPRRGSKAEPNEVGSLASISGT